MSEVTVGSAGRQYATIALFEAACPADLVAINDTWEGLLYNDSVFDLGSAGTSFSGNTTSATNYIELRAAPGEGFRDNPGSPLRVDSANGVVLRKAGSDYSSGLTIASNDVRFFGLQFETVSGNTLNATADRPVLSSCIVKHNKSNRFGVRGTSTGNLTVINSAIYGVMSSGLVTSYANASIFNSTLVSFNGSGNGVAEGAGGNNITAKNTAVFDFANQFAGTMNAASDYNVSSDTTAPGANSALSVSSAAELANVVDINSVDLKLLPGSVAMNATGTPDSANTNDVDIYGTARSLTTPCIGCFEIASSGGDDLLANSLQSLTTLTAPAIGQTHSLSANSLQSLSTLSTPALSSGGGEDNLLANSLQSLTTLSAPAVGQSHALQASSLQALSTLSTPALSEIHNLSPDSIQALSTLTQPALGQVHGLSANSLQSLVQLSTPLINRPESETLIFGALGFMSADGSGTVGLISAEGAGGRGDVDDSPVGARGMISNQVCGVRGNITEIGIGTRGDIKCP